MGFFARALSIQFTILQQVYLRIGAAFFLALVIFSNDLQYKKLKKISAREWFVLIIRSISIYVLGVTLFSQAVVVAKISNVSFISSLPIVALLGFLFLQEKISWQKIVYLIVGVLGVVLVAVKDYTNLLSWGPGEGLALISSVFIAFNFIARRWHTKLLNNKEIAVLMFAISTPILISISLLKHESLSLPITWSLFTIFVIIMAGLINVAHAFLANYGFERIETVLANNLLILSTVFATILAFFIYHEVPTIKEFIGGALIILSAYQMNRLK